MFEEGVNGVIDWIEMDLLIINQPNSSPIPIPIPTPKVLACSVLATGIAAAHALALGADDQSLNFHLDPLRAQLLCAYVGHYACCNGDTWCVHRVDRRERTCDKCTHTTSLPCRFP